MNVTYMTIIRKNDSLFIWVVGIERTDFMGRPQA